MSKLHEAINVRAQQIERLRVISADLQVLAQNGAKAIATGRRGLREGEYDALDAENVLPWDDVYDLLNVLAEGVPEPMNVPEVQEELDAIAEGEDYDY